jgi:hypothetical protein
VRAHFSLVCPPIDVRTSSSAERGCQSVREGSNTQCSFLMTSVFERGIKQCDGGDGREAAGRRELAGSGLAAFATESVKAALRSAWIQRVFSVPSRSFRSGRNVPRMPLTPQPGAGVFAMLDIRRAHRRARPQSGSGVAWLITGFVLLRRWWLRDVRSRLKRRVRCQAAASPSLGLAATQRTENR